MEISALRLETEAKNLPARVQVIDAEKIEKSGSTDLVGLLRKEANLQVRSTSGNSARAISFNGWIWRERDSTEHWFLWMGIE